MHPSLALGCVQVLVEIKDIIDLPSHAELAIEMLQDPGALVGAYQALTVLEGTAENAKLAWKRCAPHTPLHTFARALHRTTLWAVGMMIPAALRHQPWRLRWGRALTASRVLRVPGALPPSLPRSNAKAAKHDMSSMMRYLQRVSDAAADFEVVLFEHLERYEELAQEQPTLLVDCLRVVEMQASGWEGW